MKSMWSSRRIGWVVLDAIDSSGGNLILWKEEVIQVFYSIKVCFPSLFTLKLILILVGGS